MELVYLWVEDYKNIKKQGFNFSPRFKFEFKNDELTITKNDDYISIFPDNINITAIVGENGSGKSNLLESIICIIQSQSTPWDNYKVCAIFYDKNKNIFLEKNINYSLEIKNNVFDINYMIKKEDEKYNNFLLYYNYTLDYIDNEENNIDFNDLYYKQDDYSTPILLQPNKVNNSINLNTMNYLANIDMLNFTINKKIEIKNISNFFTIKTYKLEFNYKNIYKDEDEYSEFQDKLKEIYSNSKFTSFDDSTDAFRIGSNGFLKYCNNLKYLTRDGLIFVTQTYIIRKSMDKMRRSAHYVRDKHFKNLVKQYDATREISRLNKVYEYIDNKIFEDLFDDETEYKLIKIKNSFRFISFLKNCNKDFILSSEVEKIKDNEEILNHLAPWIDIEFFNEKDISFYSLSYGQKFLINFLYSILNQLNNLQSHSIYTNVILLLDEVELGLHPQWQKEYLNLLIQILNTYVHRYSFNIICSSHSPFILSDLLKENVIFLENGEQKDQFKDKQTFGANIHTLLSDGFFMSDGLMGEYAKGKIEEIKKFYDENKDLKKEDVNFNTQKIDYESKKERFRHIQSIVGEPFLQTIMKNYLDELEQIFDSENYKSKQKEKLLGQFTKEELQKYLDEK